MRRWLLALGIALVALLAWLASLDAPSDESARAPDSKPAPVTAADADVRARLPTASTDAATSSERAAVEATPSDPSSRAAVASEVPRARVHGRVVDSMGRPLADAHVELRSVNLVWREGSPRAEHEWRGRTRRGYGIATSSDGQFALDVPVPTSDVVILGVEADEYHDTHRRTFGDAGAQNARRLGEGDHRLGDIVLALKACVSGRVVDPTGAPLPNVSVAVGKSKPMSEARDSTDAAGRFRIERAPLGKRLVWAERSGYLTSAPLEVELVAGAAIEGVELALRRGQTIEGVVVDEGGQPLSRVRVLASPIHGGNSATARSSTDGAFELALSEDAPHRMEIEHAGYDAYGGNGSDEVLEPGSRGVRLVLRRALQFEFRVVDAKTDAAITRFGLRAADAPDSNSRWSSTWEPSAIRDAPGGALTIYADPAKHWIHCEAPGHAPHEGPIAADEPGGTRQTLRLGQAGRVRGRAPCNAQPTVRLERQRIQRSNGVDFDLSPFLGRVREATGAFDGSFEVGDLASGTYCLDVLCADKATTRFE
ncbi:MAG: carboxypeptidase regulatory-like domain-containing protein, partial [Planctomycetota bacterium]